MRQKFDRVCRTFVELYLSSTHGTPSKSDVAPVSLHSTASEAGLTDTPFKGGTIRKLLEGGRVDEVPKKYSRKGKQKEKKFMHAINPTKYSCYGLKKKILTRNFVTKKNFCGSKISPPPPPPPHNFSNGPSLNQNYVFHFLLMTKLPVREGNAL